MVMMRAGGTALADLASCSGLVVEVVSWSGRCEDMGIVSFGGGGGVCGLEGGGTCTSELLLRERCVRICLLHACKICIGAARKAVIGPPRHFAHLCAQEAARIT